MEEGCVPHDITHSINCQVFCVVGQMHEMVYGSEVCVCVLERKVVKGMNFTF